MLHLAIVHRKIHYHVKASVHYSGNRCGSGIAYSWQIDGILCFSLCASGLIKELKRDGLLHSLGKFLWRDGCAIIQEHWMCLEWQATKGTAAQALHQNKLCQCRHQRSRLLLRAQVCTSARVASSSMSVERVDSSCCSCHIKATLWKKLPTVFCYKCMNTLVEGVMMPTRINSSMHDLMMRARAFTWGGPMYILISAAGNNDLIRGVKNRKRAAYRRDPQRPSQWLGKYSKLWT